MPSANVTAISVRVVDDMEAGQDVAREVDDDPAADTLVGHVPPLAAGRSISMSTSDGRTVWYTISEKAGAGVIDARASPICASTSSRVSRGGPGTSTLYTTDRAERDDGARSERHDALEACRPGQPSWSSGRRSLGHLPSPAARTATWRSVVPASTPARVG